MLKIREYGGAGLAVTHSGCFCWLGDMPECGRFMSWCKLAYEQEDPNSPRQTYLVPDEPGPDVDEIVFEYLEKNNAFGLINEGHGCFCHFDSICDEPEADCIPIKEIT
jgi:hypothetical protein